MNDDPLISLDRAAFAGHVGTRFGLQHDDAQIELKLAEVDTVGGDSDHREPFAVIFLGPLEPVLPQAIYSLMHEELGVLDLFLVPVGPDKDRTGIQYEAVFT